MYRSSACPASTGDGGTATEPLQGEREEEEQQAPQLSQEETAKRTQWEREQEELKARLVEEDCAAVRDWARGEDPFASLRYVAGVDISFEKDQPDHACAMVVVMELPALEVVHVSSASVEMREPYIPGFLAFREVGFLLDRLDSIRQTCPHLMPQVIFVDGNGVLHPRGFGLASHLGVLCGIPCVGVGKTLYHVDGITRGPEHKQRVHSELLQKGDHFPLKGTSGRVWGMALRTSDDAPNPVYVSVGHGIALGTATQLVVRCSVKRVPEPIRQADLKSRALLRSEKQQQQQQQQGRSPRTDTDSDH